MAVKVRLLLVILLKVLLIMSFVSLFLKGMFAIMVSMRNLVNILPLVLIGVRGVCNTKKIDIIHLEAENPEE